MDTEPAARPFRRQLLCGVLRDSHDYVTGVGNGGWITQPWRNGSRQRLRDALFAAAARLHLAPARFDPAAAAQALSEVMDRLDGLARTCVSLGDARSKEILHSVLRFRVLGPWHVALPVRSDDFWRRCGEIDRMSRRATAVRQGPHGNYLHLYEIPGVHGTVRLVGHPLQIAEFFELEQYAYDRGGVRIAAEPGDLVLDGGGGWGDTVLYFADAVGPEGRVWCFEFVPQNVDLVEINLAENPSLAERVDLVREALWSRSGEQREYRSAGASTSLFETAGGAGAKTETVSIDDLCSRRGADRVGFIKLDVEGAELEALRGAEKTIRRFRPRLAIAVYHDLDDLVEIPAWVTGLDLGYELFLDHFSPANEETILFCRPAPD